MLKKTVFLLDGSSLCYRAFFALRLSNSKGFPTGAIYGFFQTLKKIRGLFAPEYLGICFDVSKKTFRQERFKEYKQNRPPLPDGLKVQIPLVKEMIRALGFSFLEKEGFEADDLIATLTEKALEDNLCVMIVSLDKDIYQLLQHEGVAIYNPQRERIIRKDDFLKEFGFLPALVVDYLSLVGDSVDNIPGAKGIGKVGALKLVKEFGDIENIFQHLDKLPQKTRAILEKEREAVLLSKELITLKTFPYDLSWQDLKVKEIDYPKLHSLFREMEFKSLLKEIAPPSLNVKIELKEADISLFEKTPQELYFFWSNHNFTYIYLEDNLMRFPSAMLSDFFKDKNKRKVSYDFKSQMHSLGFPIEGIHFDVLIAAYLLNQEGSDYSINNLCAYYLNSLSSDTPEEAIPFFIRRLYQVLSSKLKEEGLEKLFFEVEMPLVLILWEMEDRGLKIDLAVLSLLFKELEREIERIKEGIFKISGKEFNLNSPKTMGEVLFKELKIPPLHKTKTGYSTAEGVLEKLAPQYPIAALLLEYRQLNKLNTTYVKPLIEMVQKNNSKLHTTFNQTATATGRLSSSSPNLQSIPIKGKFAHFLRRAFISSFASGYILSADYSQIELRLLAHFSDDQRLKEAFLKGLDIHRYTASLLFKIEESRITDEQRALAKTINFGIIYGLSPYGLANHLNISLQEAEAFIQEYFLRYPQVKSYLERCLTEAENTGYVKTILGRKRKLPDLKSNNQSLKEFAQRQAINTPIQGSCADLIKSAMIKIYQELKKQRLRTRLILQIHDELVFDVPEEELKKVVEIIKANMENALNLNIPLQVNLKVGRNWAEMQEYI